MLTSTAQEEFSPAHLGMGSADIFLCYETGISGIFDLLTCSQSNLWFCFDLFWSLAGREIEQAHEYWHCPISTDKSNTPTYIYSSGFSIIPAIVCVEHKSAPEILMLTILKAHHYNDRAEAQIQTLHITDKLQKTNYRHICSPPY